MALNPMLAPMTAGRLNRRAVLERKTVSDDGHGGQTEVWKRVGDPWIAGTLIGGKEGLLAGTLAAQENWRIEMRWRADVTPADRLLFQGRTINIRSAVDPDGRRERLVILGDTLTTGAA